MRSGQFGSLFTHARIATTGQPPLCSWILEVLQLLALLRLVVVIVVVVVVVIVVVVLVIVWINVSATAIREVYFARDISE